MNDDASAGARAMQRKSADAIKGTDAARERAAKAGRSVSPEAARARAIKAAAARHAKNKPTS